MFRDKKSRAFPLFIVGIIVILVVFIGIFENTRIETDIVSISFPELPSELEGANILQLSDLNGRRFGEKQAKLIAEIKKTKYELIVVTGNMCAPDGDPSAFYEILEGLEGEKPVYFLCGDGDPAPVVYNDVREQAEYSEYILGAIERGAIYLDVPMPIAKGNGSVWLSPERAATIDVQANLDSLEIQRKNPEITPEAKALAEYHVERFLRIQQQQQKMKPSDIRIALFHHPLRPKEQSLDHVFVTETDLVLAGHYTGGTWRIPLLGAPHVNTPDLGRNGWFPPQNLVSGLTKVDGDVRQYITRGLGARVTPQWLSFRLFNPAQISVLELTRNGVDDSK